MSKKATVLRLVLVTLTLSLVLNGCDWLQDLFGETLSISERIDGFIDELNTNSRTTVGEHIHPSATEFGALQSSTPWEVGPLSTANRDFSWTAGATTDNGDGTMDVTGTLTSDTGTVTFANALFTMQEAEQENWKIRLFNLDTTDMLTTWDITKLQ